MHLKLLATGAAAALLLSANVAAHNPLAPSGDRLPLLLAALLLVLVWASYCLGAVRLTPGRYQWAAFQAAMLVTAFTIFGPLDTLAETSTAMHMTQHMLMMVVIPPLMVMAQPLPQWSAAAARWTSASSASTSRLWRPWLRWARYPMLLATLHAAVVWFWHAPRLYVLALEDPWWHVVEHACFLLSAGLFWWAVLRSGHRAAPRAMLALLFTLMHTGFLGALLSFSGAPLYGDNRDLQDQQLAGLLMWVLGGLPYLAAAAWCGQRWFQQMLRRSPG